MKPSPLSRLASGRADLPGNGGAGMARPSSARSSLSQPGSPHLEDQLPFMVQKKLPPILRDRKEIEAGLERRETF